MVDRGKTPRTLGSGKITQLEVRLRESNLLNQRGDPGYMWGEENPCLSPFG